MNNLIEHKPIVSLDGEAILKLTGTNAHQLHLQSGISYPTIQRILKGQSSASLDYLIKMLNTGMEIGEIMNLRIGDIMKMEEVHDPQ